MLMYGMPAVAMTCFHQRCMPFGSSPLSFHSTRTPIGSSFETRSLPV
jgi:hypothetical protein